MPKFFDRQKKSLNLRFLLFPHTRLEAGHVSTRVVFTLPKQLTGRFVQQRYIDEITTLQHIFIPVFFPKILYNLSDLTFIQAMIKKLIV